MRAWIVLPTTAAAIISPALAHAQTPPVTEKEFVPAEEFQTFVTQLVREQLPHEYEKKRNWGTTKRVFSGVDVGLDGLRLDTKRKFSDKNHGTWQMYFIKQVEPEKNLAVRIDRVQELDGGQVACEVSAVGRLHCFGKQVQWERGVQVYALSADCEATVRVKTRTILRPRLDATKFPPDVLLLAKVERAEIEILDFELQRVGEFDGPVIRSFSKTIREILEDRLAADHDKIVVKINEQLTKKQDKLRLKWADLLKTPWAGYLRGLGTE